MKYSRDETLERLRSTVESGEPIIGAGAGTGMSAKFAERGGVDLLIIYNAHPDKSSLAVERWSIHTITA